MVENKPQGAKVGAWGWKPRKYEKQKQVDNNKVRRGKKAKKRKAKKWKKRGWEKEGREGSVKNTLRLWVGVLAIGFRFFFFPFLYFLVAARKRERGGDWLWGIKNLEMPWWAWLCGAGALAVRKRKAWFIWISLRGCFGAVFGVRCGKNLSDEAGIWQSWCTGRIYYFGCAVSAGDLIDFWDSCLAFLLFCLLFMPKPLPRILIAFRALFYRWRIPNEARF